MKKIKIKRIYDEPVKTDGVRILVDRLWPRGIKKADVKIDLWLKEVAPSNELRKWYNHDVSKWSDFKRRYEHELVDKTAELDKIKQEAHKKTVTLLYAAKDTDHNNAVVLREVLAGLD